MGVILTWTSTRGLVEAVVRWVLGSIIKVQIKCITNFQINMFLPHEYLKKQKREEKAERLTPQATLCMSTVHEHCVFGSKKGEWDWYCWCSLSWYLSERNTELLSQEGLKTSKDDQRTHHSNNAENTYKMMYQTFGIQIFEKIREIQDKNRK